MLRLHGVGFLDLLTGDYQPPPRFRLSALLILLAIVAVLVGTGLVRRRQRGFDGFVRDVQRLATEAEKRNQKVSELARP